MTEGITKFAVKTLPRKYGAQEEILENEERLIFEKQPNCGSRCRRKRLT